MRLKSSFIRDIALYFFLALGLGRAANDVISFLMNLTPDPPKPHDYVMALLLTALMFGWKYLSRKSPKEGQQDSQSEQDLAN